MKYLVEMDAEIANILHKSGTLRIIMEKITKKHFVGTCVNSFDSDGECSVPDLPWSDVSAFAVADQDAVVISSQEFLSQVEMPLKLWRKVSRDTLKYMVADGVLILYDDDKDIHYFFV